MTRLTRVNDQDPNFDADIALITDYLCDEASADEVRTVNRRLKTDMRFYKNVALLIEVWTLPFATAPSSDGTNAIRLPTNRFSREARQAEWDRWHKFLGRPSIPLEEIENDKTDPILFFPRARRRRLWKRIMMVALVTTTVVVSGAAYVAWKSASAYKTSRAEAKAGTPMTLTSALWMPDIYETKLGEERRVQVGRAAITLKGSSRLSVGGPADAGTVDGQAIIEVPPKKRFVLFAAGLNVFLWKGRYRVTHAPGPITRIVVDSGHVTLHSWAAVFRIRKPPTYWAGTTMTLEEKGTNTTVRAVTRDGTVIPMLTKVNRAVLPRMEMK